MGLFFALVLIGAFTAAAYYDMTLITGTSVFSMEPKKSPAKPAAGASPAAPAPAPVSPPPAPTTHDNSL